MYYNQYQNYLTCNQNMQTSKYSEYPSTCEVSPTYIQNAPNYSPEVENSSLECEPEIKPKVKRIIFTYAQKKELEKEFEKDLYISLKRKAELAETLNLSQHQVKVWFQNKRQLVKRDMARAACNNSYNLPQNTATTPTLQSQHHTNPNENYVNNLYFHSNEAADQNLYNCFLTNSIPFNNNQYNTCNFSNTNVAQPGRNCPGDRSMPDTPSGFGTSIKRSIGQ